MVAPYLVILGAEAEGGVEIGGGGLDEDFAVGKGVFVAEGDGAEGEWEAAVELYFALVGKRWDKEWLVTAVVAGDDPRKAAAELGEVASAGDLREQRQLDERLTLGPSAQRERAG